MAVEKSIREEAFRRADRLHCSAAATLILAGDRNGWPQDRVDELRPLFGALLPSIDDLDEKFGKGYFVRNLPPAVAMYIGALLRHTVAAKWRGTTTLRDDAARAIAQIDLSRTPVSRPRTGFCQFFIVAPPETDNAGKSCETFASLLLPSYLNRV